MSAPAAGMDERSRERYYTASQWQLIRWRFMRHRTGVVAALVLAAMFTLGLFAEFFSPYTNTERDSKYIYGPPQLPSFWDGNGFSLRPFVHAVKTERDPVTLKSISVPDPETRRYIRFFVEGEPYRLLGLIPMRTRLFGVDEGKIHLLGTDTLGRDLYSRTLGATRTSLSIGAIGALVSFTLALIIGGVSAYLGGLADYSIQRVTEVVRVVPVIPLYMGLAAAFPAEWSNTQTYFAMSLIFGLVGWPTLARRVRSHLLSQRNEDYVIAAQLCAASPGRIIFRHMLPSFTSYIIVDLVITFPYVILSETALSFVGLGLRPPTVSWGVLLQEGQSVRAIEQAPWLLFPAGLVVLAVLAFTIFGDALRDAADPYAR